MRLLSSLRMDGLSQVLQPAGCEILRPDRGRRVHILTSIGKEREDLKKETRSEILITKPSGEMVQREIRLTYEDVFGGLFEVEILGDSPLQNYKFAVRQGDLKTVRDHGKVIS